MMPDKLPYGWPPLCLRIVLLSALVKVMSHDCRGLHLVKYNVSIKLNVSAQVGQLCHSFQGSGNIMERGRRSMVIR